MNAKAGCLLFFLLSTCVVKAQWYPGLTAGIQITALKDKQDKTRWNAGNGFQLGVFVDRPFLKHKIGARMEGTYSLVTEQDKVRNDKLTLNYLSVPLSFFYMPNNQVQLFIGPQVNILFHQEGPAYVTSRGKERFEPIDYGLHASLEMGFAHNLSIAFRYYQGLNYNSKNELDNLSDSLNRISAIQLCVNFFLRTHKSELKKNTP